MVFAIQKQVDVSSDVKAATSEVILLRHIVVAGLSRAAGPVPQSSQPTRVRGGHNDASPFTKALNDLLPEITTISMGKRQLRSLKSVGAFDTHPTSVSGTMALGCRRRGNPWRCPRNSASASVDSISASRSLVGRL